MSMTHISPALEKRIKELNKKIDSKILRGKPYKSEAREHRMLMLKMRGTTNRTFFANSLSFLHFF